MSISKNYIRKIISNPIDNMEFSSQKYSKKQMLKLAIYKVFSKTPIIYKHRKRIKGKVLSVPFLRRYLIKNKSKLLKTPIIKDIIALFR